MGKVGDRNLHDSKRENNIQRRTGPRSRRADDDNDEVDEPDEGLDDRRNQVEGRFQFAGGEEADFDQGEEDGHSCYGDYDCAGGSVLEMYLSVEEGLLHFHAGSIVELTKTPCCNQHPQH